MSHFDPTQIESTAKRLGEVVLDPGEWPSFLEDLSEAVGATGALLLQSDVRTPDVPRTSSIDDLIDAYFREGWHLRDLRANRGAPLLMAGRQVITDADVFASEREMLGDSVTVGREAMGYKGWAAIGFYAGQAHWVLSLQRRVHEGLFEKHETKVLAKLSQRLTEAATLSMAIGRQSLLGVTNALDLVGIAALTLDRYGYVIGTNARAEELFDSEIKVQYRRLVMRDVVAKTALASLIERLRTTSDLDVFPANPIVVRRSVRPPIITQALPVPGAARNPFLGARLILTLTSLETKPAPNHLLLSQAFDFTMQEARLASILAQGISLAEAARRLGISELTARSYLKAVFAKTRTHRQAELVAVLAYLSL